MTRAACPRRPPKEQDALEVHSKPGGRRAADRALPSVRLAERSDTKSWTVAGISLTQTSLTS